MQYITWNPPILSNPKSLQIKYKLNNARTASNLKSYSISKSSNKSVKMYLRGFPGGSVAKNPPASAGDRFNSWSERSSGEGNGNPLQYSCLGNPMSRRVWWATGLPGWGHRVGHD